MRRLGLGRAAVRRLCGFTLEAVALAPYRLNQLWFCRVVLQFLAEAAHMDIHQALVAGVFEIPGLVDELGAPDHLAAPPGEGVEQVEFDGREFDLFSVLPDDSCGGIDGDLLEIERSAAMAPRPGRWLARAASSRVEGLAR